MEHYVADTLAARLEKSGTLSVKETEDILCLLLADLKILHDNKLIHRDIKPANIVFVDGEAKLGDIGLVANDASMTAAAGTPLYMPPPESGIKNNSIEADLYALAMVAYCCLSGNTPDKYPDINFTDDISANGKELMRYINTACHPQKHFHSVSEIYKEFPASCKYQVAVNDLYAWLRLKPSAKQMQPHSMTKEKNTFLVKLQKKHPTVAALLGILLAVCFEIADLAINVLDFLALPITIPIWFLKQVMSKKKSRKP